MALGVGFNDRRVNDGHHVPGLVQVSGERLAVSAGGFEAGVGALDVVLGEPGRELREAGGCVREDAVAELTGVADEAGVELQLRDIDAERRSRHGVSPLRSYTRRRASLVDASSSRGGEA